VTFYEKTDRCDKLLKQRYKIFCFSQSQFSYFLATYIPNFKLLIDSNLPKHAAKIQLLFFSSQSSCTIKWEWVESKASITN